MTAKRWARGDGVSDCFGIAEIGVDRRDNDTRFNGKQVNANERDAHPGVDDDAFVEDAVEHIDQTGAAGCTLHRHGVILRARGDA